MDVLIYLVPVALILGLLGLAAFIWSIKSGQYDDLEGAALRILIDDDDYIPARSGKNNDENNESIDKGKGKDKEEEEEEEEDKEQNNNHHGKNEDTK